MNKHRIPQLLWPLLGGLLLIALAACATAPTPPPALQNPTVELDHVEVASYFPWPAAVPTVEAGTPTPVPVPPARIPLVVAFIFNVSNPNSYPVTLKDLQFTVEFEAAPDTGEFFQVGNPFAHEDMAVPANTTNQLRVTMVLDSLVAPGNLAVTSGFRLQELGLKGGEVVKNWWTTIGDFAFKIKVSGGSAEFSSSGGGAVVGFEGLFPQ
ncbi:MAG: hypothetical protein HY784_01195 [Chloroflexi bacterium]|nr:hypothetical protein [Chloroflexota bacterium]